MTLEEVAKELGVTRQRVCQIEKQAIEKIKKSFRARVLRPYAYTDAEPPTKEDLEALDYMANNRPLDPTQGLCSTR